MTKKTDTKTDTKEVTVVESKLVEETRRIGAPGVIAIGGKILDPIAQVRKVSGPIVHNDIVLADYPFSSVGDKAAMLNIYAYSLRTGGEVKQTDLFIVADELSSLDLSDPRHLVYQAESFTVITLVNSRSQGDFFKGSVLLSCVDSEGNAYEDSRIDMMYERMHSLFGNHAKNPDYKRVVIRDVEAEQLKVDGRNLPPGFYYNADLIETTFIRGEKDEGKRIRIINSTVTWSHFKEGNIEINDARIAHCGFHFSGDVFLKKVALENEHFRDIVPGIHLGSKFDITDIDVAGKRPAKMIRVDKDNVLITLPPEREDFTSGGNNHKFITMSFRNPNSRRNLRVRAMEMCFGEAQPSEVEESVIDYFVDTVLSRVSMINLMDTAQRLVDSNLLGVKPRIERPGLPWNEALDAVKDHPRTIYIDGNNFK